MSKVNISKNLEYYALYAKIKGIVTPIIDMTPTEFKKLFHSEQYEYFKSLGFEFAIVNPYRREDVAMATNIGAPAHNKILEKFGEAYHCKDKFKFTHIASSSSHRHVISPENVEKEHLEFYSLFYHKYPECQKIMLKDYWSFFMSDGERLLKLTQVLTYNKTATELAQFILDFPVNAWGIDGVKLEAIDSFLKEKGLSEQETDDFFLKFIYARKKELKSSIDGTYVRDFLFQKYGSNSPIISQYHKACPAIKAYFKKPKIDFVEKDAEFSTVILVSLKKIEKSFMIENWSEYKYMDALHTFCNGIQKIYNLKVCRLLDSDTTPKGYSDKSTQYNIFTLHDEKSFTKELLQKTLTDFFIHLQENLSFELTVSNVEKWVEKYELHKELSQLPKSSNNRIKFSKI